MGTKWLEPSEREAASVLRRSDLGLAALAGAGATLVAVGLLLPVDAGRHYTSSVVRTQDRSPVSLYGPRNITVQPCTEDGIILADGSCGHPSTAHFSDGYWFQGASDDAGTIAPLRLER